jgi:hypothetical protein
LPFAGALIAHQTPFFASAHLAAGDKVAVNAESKHGNLHFFIFSHFFTSFLWIFRFPIPKKRLLK